MIFNNSFTFFKEKIRSLYLNSNIYNKKITPSIISSLDAELEPEFYSMNALSVYHTIRKQRTNEKLMYHDVMQTHKTKQGTKLYFKAFLVVSPKLRTPVFCSPDSGSDISLIYQPLLFRLLSPQEIEKRKTPCRISVVQACQIVAVPSP